MADDFKGSVYGGLVPVLEAGDVIEFDSGEGVVSALVLLASGDAAIIDLLDGSTPLSVLVSEIPDLRVFSGDDASAAA